MIDLSNQFVLPGLIDAHTHILSQQEPNSREIRVTRSDELSTLMGYEFGMRTLRAGFTTIRNVGGTRNAIFARVMPSIRALSWGHASKRPVRESHRPVVMVTEADFATTYFRILTPECAMALTECRKAVRTQVKYGADHIKYVATGGVLSLTATGTEQQFTDEEQIALVQAAHAMGRKVAAHAHGKTGMMAALLAGVDSIEHGSYLDEEVADLFANWRVFGADSDCRLYGRKNRNRAA